MEEQIPWNKIIYYLTHEEESFDGEFISWLDSSKQNKTLWEETQLMYSMTGELPDQFTPNEKRAWHKIEQRISTFKSKQNVYQFFLRVAASLLLVAIGASASYFLIDRLSTPVYTEIYSPYGHKTKVILPDSSTVWLNGDSQLRYETSFASAREVELMGEALFDVRTDNNRLFSVKSNKLKVEVYGTIFNFKHYPEEENAEVALLEGSIGLYAQNSFLEQISPGQVADYNLSTNSYNISERDISPIISWSTDELTIDNETFRNVMTYLERWYGVDINIDDELKIDQRLSFKVKTESLQELLSIIDHIVPIEYKIDGKDVEISRK